MFFFSFSPFLFFFVFFTTSRREVYNARFDESVERAEKEKPLLHSATICDYVWSSHTRRARAPMTTRDGGAV